MAPNVSPPIASTAVTKPTLSNGGLRGGDGLVRAASATATTPTGMLMRKISRHEHDGQQAAEHGADDEAIAPPIAQIATARARRAGSG